MVEHGEDLDPQAPACIKLPNVGTPNPQEWITCSFVYYESTEPEQPGKFTYAGLDIDEDLRHRIVHDRGIEAGVIAEGQEPQGGGNFHIDRWNENGTSVIAVRISKSSHTFKGYVDRGLIRQLWGKIAEYFKPEDEIRVLFGD